MCQAGRICGGPVIETPAGLYLAFEPATASGRGTSFHLTFPSVRGVGYIVQYQDALHSTGAWLPLVTNAGTGGVITKNLPVSAGPPARFYRILVP